MKKHEPEQKENIIYFPNLDKRLLEKGLDAIQQKKYKDALPLLNDALERNPDNSDIKIGLILSYYELGMLDDAKLIAKGMLAEGSGDYLQVLDLYIMILVQLHEYEEIVTTIEVLLEDHQIPANKMEHFSKMLEFSRKMAKSNIPEEDMIEKVEIDESPINLLSISDTDEQMLLIANLSNRNIRSYIEEVSVFLASEKYNPFLKTMLLNILKDQEYDKEITIEKFNRAMQVIPSNLENVQQQSQISAIINILKDKVESNDPILFENIKMLLDRQAFILYPYKLEDFSEETWALAYHSVVNEYFGQNEIDDLLPIYGVELENLHQAKQFIYQLEEISYPNI